jgi:hypothetical protein
MAKATGTSANAELASHLVHQSVVGIPSTPDRPAEEPFTVAIVQQARMEIEKTMRALTRSIFKKLIVFRQIDPLPVIRRFCWPTKRG